MTAPIKHIIQKNTFWLSAQRCLFWEEEQALILSDLHLGKTGHFRKHGIAIPQKVFIEDMQRLVEQVIFYKPTKIIAVGDLFHSHANKELDLFARWRNDFPGIEFILVKGNHDILKKDWYDTAGIKVYEGIYSIGNFDFVHDPDEACEETKDSNFVFCGHLHPGINIQGVAKQNLTFPCYYFTGKQAIIPAFSKFSGLAMVKKTAKDTIYAIVNQSLVKIK
jgi:DNA ligase-associated metallophosphoesterase